jgi:glycosyltransferase involved in cell wall biosynthesis
MAKKQIKATVVDSVPNQPNKEDIIAKLTGESEKFDKKENKIYFWIVDSKQNPSGSQYYIYNLAYNLLESGHRVEFLYQADEDDEFVGVGEILGQKYMNDIPHHNIKKENISINICDILIIPEVFSSLMHETKKLPCKRIVLCQNFNLIAETMPVGVEFGSHGILDVITTSEKQKDLLLEVMPYLKVNIIEPVISPLFFERLSREKDLQVAIVSNDRTAINRIVKLFYLKYPIFKFVSFKQLAGLPHETFADELEKSVACVWYDYFTNFGYTPLEAMRCGTIPICVIPEEPTDWMLKDGGGLTESVIWCSNINTVHNAISSVINTYIEDNIPITFRNSMKSFDDKYSKETQKAQTQLVFEQYINDKKDEIKQLLQAMEK